MSQVAKTRILWLMLRVIARAGIEYPLAHPWASTSVPHRARRGGADDNNTLALRTRSMSAIAIYRKLTATLVLKCASEAS